MARVLNSLAERYRKQRKYVEAEPLYTRAVGNREKAYGKDDPRLATVLNSAALLDEAAGKTEEACLLQESVRQLHGKDEAARSAAEWRTDTTPSTP